MMADSFASLTSVLSSDLKDLKSLDQLDDAQRMSMLSKIDHLRDAMMLPVKSLRTVTHGPSKIVVARLAIAMGIFDVFAMDSHGVLPKLSLEEIMPNVKGDQQFVVRMLRFLSVKGFLEQDESAKWRATQLGAMMTTNSVGASAVITFYHNLKAYGTLLDFMTETNFRNPEGHGKSPWTYAYDTADSYWHWIGQDELRQSAFNKLMHVNQKVRGPDWFEFFPITEKLQALQTNDKNNVLLVDIGGGSGHDALLFRKKYPDLLGKVVVQDLPSVVREATRNVSWPANFEMQEHDFFTPQPIHGASMYYLRSVLHDWPDVQAITILQNIKEAMSPDSVLLVNEALMPEDRLDEIAIEIDFVMMTCYASLERTEQQWCDLLDAAGFRVVQTWRPESHKQISATALFEAVPR